MRRIALVQDLILRMRYQRLYRANLVDVRNAFDAAGVAVFLNCGTLLGAWRDGRPCLNDWRDIDLSVRHEDLDDGRKARILERLDALGFVSPANRRFENPRQSRFDRGRNRVDIFHYTRQGDYYFRYWSSFGDVPMIVPARYVEKLDRVTFCGDEFGVPSETDSFLTLTMGLDWRRPRSMKGYKARNAIRRREHEARHRDLQAGQFDEALYLARGMGWERDADRGGPRRAV